MCKRIIRNLISLSIILSVLGTTAMVYGANENLYGAREMTSEERALFEEEATWIKDVKLNRLAYNRLKSNVSAVELSSDESMEIARIGNEVSVYEDASDTVNLEAFEIKELPTTVDNSNEDFFPMIESQAGNSCAAWSTVYYQLTSNTNMIRGQKAKTKVGAEYIPVEENVFSPRWAYNLIANPNTEKQTGINAHDIYRTLINYGCPSRAYVNVDSEVNNTWSPDKDVWRYALNNKPEGVVYLQLASNGEKTVNEKQMDNMKTLLADGYVLSFMTYIGSWVRVDDDDKILVSHMRTNELGQLSGGHQLTIVGYDDNLWIDVNNNGIHDDGEYGAIKVANSWGNWDYKGGFCWIAYDALNSSSALITDNKRRGIIVNNEVGHLQPSVSYTPLLTAEISLETNCREQICLYIGVSDQSTTTPYIMKKVANSKYKRTDPGGYEEEWNIAFSHYNRPQYINGGHVLDVESYNFSGNKGYETKTFTFDLSQLLYNYPLEQNGKYRFYVKLKDNDADGNNNRLCNIKVFDNVKENEIANIQLSNAIADGNEVTAYFDYKLDDLIVSSDKQFTANFNYPILSSSVNANNIYIIDRRGILNRENVNIFGNYTNIDFTKSSDSKSISIIPPQNEYLSGTCYDLFMTNGLKSLGGNSFGTINKTSFYVK